MSNRVSYGHALTSVSRNNYESSNLLNNNKFAIDGLSVQAHAVYSVNKHTFTDSATELAWYPPMNNNPQIWGKITLWELMARVGFDLLTHVEDQSGGDGDNPHQNTDLPPPPELPKVVYRLNDKLHSDQECHEGFNRKSAADQQTWVDQHSYVIVDTHEAYLQTMTEYQAALTEYTQTMNKKGQNYVLLEYFTGRTDPDNVSGYRIWILQEQGAKSSITQKFSDRISFDSIQKKNLGKRKHKQEKTFHDLWQNINSNGALAKTVGNSLYDDAYHFDLRESSRSLLSNKENPAHPETIFSCGQWNQIICGTDGSVDAEGNPIRMNHLPCLYPNCDIDPQRFVWNNYFDAELTVFKPHEDFRSSMILLNARDLAEDIFMSKYRLDAYVKYVLPMMRTTLGNILKPKASKAIQVGALSAAVSERYAFASKPIVPSKEPQFEGQSFHCVNPSTSMSTIGINGKVMHPGESNSFFYQRALAHQHNKPYFEKLMKYATTRNEKKTARIKALGKALEYLYPIFNGSGNCNIGKGLSGIINTQNRLKKQNFSCIFIEMPNLHRDLSFQDNFMAWMLNGQEFYMYLSTLHCDFYRLLINSGCAYLLIRDKTHTCQSGDPGTGKSELLHVITMLKCPGVCQAEANASALAHFFGDDKHFLIKIRNEPDPMRDGGSAIKGNAAAMRLTEIEKSMRSEQEGEKSISQFDAVLGKYVERKIHVWLSMVILENSNHAMNKRSKARNDRDHKVHIAKTIRPKKNVAYMKSSQGSQSEPRSRQTQMFINKNHWIDQEFAKICAMMDVDGGLSDVSYDIFDDVQDYLQSHLELNVRSIERCRNNCRTQIIYNVINILFHHRPFNKVLQFYIGEERVGATLNQELGQTEVFVNDQETKTMYKFEHHCTLYRDEDQKLHSGPHPTRQWIPVECVIDLINNIIYSKDTNNIDETGKPLLLLEEQKLQRKWILKNLWRPRKSYKEGSVCRVHVTGEESQYASYYVKFKCLKEHVNQAPDLRTTTEYWERLHSKKESLLGKYFQQEIKYSGAYAIEQWMDINRLLYCDVGTAIRTIALMRSEFVAPSQDKIHREIVRMGINRLKAVDTSSPCKSFYPVRDRDEKTNNLDDVDPNYICIGSETLVKLELAEQLKKKLTVGLLVNTSEIVLSTTIEDLHQNTSANVYYKNFGGSPTSYPYMDGETWKLDFNNALWKDKRNYYFKEQDQPFTRQPVILKKKCGSTTKLYVLVAWLDDFHHDTREEEDRFLSILSSYNYPALNEEKTTILIGHPWSGKVHYKDREDQLKHIDWCDPSISKAITIKGGPQHKKVFKEKNVVDSISQKIQGRPMMQSTATIHRIDIDYDDYAMKLRLKHLDEYDHTMDIKRFVPAYSVRHLHKELNSSQKPILNKTDSEGNLIEYTRQHVNDKFERETGLSTHIYD